MSEAVPADLAEELIGRRLDTMPALPRTVFLLRHLDGLDVAAIGARLGIGIEVVEQELARAMRVLVFGVDEPTCDPGRLGGDRAW
ncbi:RNA polymerase sigma factor [Sphingomonas sp.]|uniref:RNA polymerase sigma factor n=1 Tax=Sphingomonas sp. TaxID=28214 RepID=UPI003D6C70AB